MYSSNHTHGSTPPSSQSEKQQPVSSGASELWLHPNDSVSSFGHYSYDPNFGVPSLNRLESEQSITSSSSLFGTIPSSSEFIPSIYAARTSVITGSSLASLSPMPFGIPTQQLSVGSGAATRTPGRIPQHVPRSYDNTYMPQRSFSVDFPLGGSSSASMNQVLSSSVPSFPSQTGPMRSSPTPSSSGVRAPMTTSTTISFPTDFMFPKRRFRTNQAQFDALCRFFDENPLPSSAVRQRIASMLGMTPRSVQIWFQNRRAKLRNKEKSQKGESLSAPASPVAEARDLISQSTTSNEPGDSHVSSSAGSLSNLNGFMSTGSGLMAGPSSSSLPIPSFHSADLFSNSSFGGMMPQSSQTPFSTPIINDTFSTLSASTVMTPLTAADSAVSMTGAPAPLSWSMQPSYHGQTTSISNNNLIAMTSTPAEKSDVFTPSSGAPATTSALHPNPHARPVLR